ncbi:MAG: zinc ribbon domain-containing protein [Candidatus Zixiibacteriota bacterium]|jgi:hypothetical protein
MRALFIILTAAFAAAPVAAQVDDNAGNIFSDKLQCFLAAPPGWFVDTSRSDEIIISESPQSPIFISVKRYFIEDGNQISSEDDLRQAISGLYRKMGVPLAIDSIPKYQLDLGKAHFETDFTALAIDGRTKLRKYVSGTIVRLTDGRQALYLLIAEAPSDIYYHIFPSFLMSIRSFHITATTAPKVLFSAGIFKYFLIGLLVMLTIFFFARNRRVQKSFNPLGADSHNFWRCASCGRVNHNDVHFCNRCGAARVIINAPNK